MGTIVDYIKIICVSEDPLEYQVLEDVNRGDIQEASTYIQDHYNDHIGARWMIIPYSM